MYKVFVNDKPITLTTKVEQETDFKNYLLNTVHIGKVIKDLNTTSLKEVRLIHKDKDKLLKKFLKKLPNVVAGGGKVFNDHGDILFIYRNDKWDLPKGKIEGNETIEKTAIREVTEETGIRKLKITGDLVTTYHTYEVDGIAHLKTTFWYSMIHHGEDTIGKPQEIEGITEVKWVNSNVPEKIWKSTYGSIRIVYNTFLKTTELA